MAVSKSSSSNKYKLMQVIVQHSIADNWENARFEWDMIRLESSPAWDPLEDGVPGENTCVCGKQHLVHLYTIQNTYNSNILHPIGSRCIKHFQVKRLDDAMKVANNSEKIITDGRYKGCAYDYLCTHQPKYIEFVRLNAKKQKYAKLVQD